MFVCVCKITLYACVLACVFACLRACVHACICACVHMCERSCVCVHECVCVCCLDFLEAMLSRDISKFILKIGL
jgi:hypothetical protein